MDKPRSLTVRLDMDNHSHKHRLLLLLSTGLMDNHSHKHKLLLQLNTGLMDNSDSPSSSLLSLNSPSNNTAFSQHRATQVRCLKHMVDKCHKHTVDKWPRDMVFNPLRGTSSRHQFSHLGSTLRGVVWE